MAMIENDDGSITFSASLPPLQSAITLDGYGDGARVKMDIPRTDVDAAKRLQKWAQMELQRRWVMARLFTKTDIAAARIVGVHPSTVCKWPNKAELDATVDKLLEDPLAQAVETLREGLPDAAKELIALAKHSERNKHIRIRAIEGVLDRNLGKPTQRQEVDVTSGGEPIRVIGGVNLDEL